jgi:hypothetical protein
MVTYKKFQPRRTSLGVSRVNRLVKQRHTAPAFGSFLNIPRPRSVSMFSPVGKRPAATMWGDSDGDGVYNGFDCEPFNKRKQGPYHRKTLTSAQANSLFKAGGTPLIKTKWQEDNEFENERKEFLEEQERDKLGLSGNSSIMKRSTNKVLVRHFDSDSPASESPVTFEIKDNSGKCIWKS